MERLRIQTNDVMDVSNRVSSPRNYDTAIFLRFLPATAGEDVRTFVWDGLSGEERPLGVSVFGCGCGPLLLAFELGACERPFTILCELPWISGTWPFDIGA